MNEPPANSYGISFMRELDAAVDAAEGDEACRVVVVRGAVPGFFCGDADIKQFRSNTPAQNIEMITVAHETLGRLAGEKVVHSGGFVMTCSLVTYFDHKSPYAFVAKDLIQELAVECGVTLEWRPYTLRIPDFLGSAEVNERGERVADARNGHQWRRVKYIYMDCRRLAARRGLTFHAPRKVFESFVAHVGMLYARRRGAFQRYHDTVYERFWRRELDVDSVAEISQVLRSIGVGAEEFPAFVEGAGRLEHDHIMDEAHALGVFGVPSFIVDGELYWGGEHLPALRERLGRGADA